MVCIKNVKSKPIFDAGTLAGFFFVVNNLFDLGMEHIFSVFGSTHKLFKSSRPKTTWKEQFQQIFLTANLTANNCCFKCLGWA